MLKDDKKKNSNDVFCFNKTFPCRCYDIALTYRMTVTSQSNIKKIQRHLQQQLPSGFTTAARYGRAVVYNCFSALAPKLIALWKLD